LDLKQVFATFGIDPEGTIFPGAADNALGVGKLMAVAEVIGHMNPKPRRSIIFIATTGVIKAVAAARRIEIVPDPTPEESFFTRG